MSKSELTSETKLLVTEYVSGILKGWLAWIGIANLAAIALGMIYIYFILPNKAVSEAKLLMEDEVSNVTSLLQLKSQNALENLGGSRERVKILSEDLDELNQKVQAVEDTVELFEKGDIPKAVSFLQRIEETKSVDRLLTRVGELENKLPVIGSIEGRLNHLEGDKSYTMSSRCRLVQGKGTNGDSWLTSSKAMCRDNEIATGGGCTAGSAATGTIGRMADNTTKGYECITSHRKQGGVVTAQAVCCL